MVSALMAQERKQKRKAMGGEAHVGSLRERVFLGAACFASGAVIMAVELAGNRLITPVFGNTMYTWTGLISVVLVAIAVGDYIGGWLVDRFPSFRVLGGLFIAGGIITALVLPAMELVRPLLSGLSVVWGPIWVSLWLFSLPACVMAAVSPFTVRLLSRTLDDRRIGLSAGLVGMLATLGSFIGTVATGIYLIPTVGLRAIFLGCALLQFVLGVLALWFFGGRVRVVTGSVVTLVFAGSCLLAWLARPPAPEGFIWGYSSFYHDISVIDHPRADGTTARLLKLDTTNEGAQVVETGELVFDYQRYWELATIWLPEVRRALFIGGGGFGMPQHLARRHPDAAVEVVELDPKVIEVGRLFFRLDEHPTVEAIAMDGRRFLERTPGGYDLIFGDAYSGVHSVPAHLTTVEFFELLRSKLAPDGVYLMNLISAFRGPTADFFEAVYATLREVFPHVLVFAVVDPLSTANQNLILAASSRDLLAEMPSVEDAPSFALRRIIGSRVPEDALQVEGVRVITDNLNPSEHIVADQLRAQRLPARSQHR